MCPTGSTGFSKHMVGAVPSAPRSLRSAENRCCGSVSIVFSLADAPTQFGEVIRIVGSHPALGAWDTDRSIALETNEDLYPRWIAPEISLDFSEALSAPGKVEYKFLRDRHACGGTMEWEDLAN